MVRIQEEESEMNPMSRRESARANEQPTNWNREEQGTSRNTATSNNYLTKIFSFVPV